MVNGILRLRAELRDDRTVLTDVYRTPPFVIGVASYRSDPRQAEVIIQQTSPGLLPRNSLEVEITVAAGARLVVRGQSATKLYPCGEGEVSRVCARYHVESDGELIVLPGELIPFHDADSVQTIDVQLEPGSRFVTGEVITPGRIAMGESHGYRRLELRLKIRQADRLLLFDRAVIEPSLRGPQRLGIAGAFRCAGSFYLVGCGDLAFDPSRQRPDLRWAAGTTGNFTTVRILGQRAADILALREELTRTAL